MLIAAPRPSPVPRFNGNVTIQPAPSSAAESALEIVPLGGLREFGMNMMAIRFGDTLVVIDAGVMFPEPELPGVDLIIPDCSYLQDLKVTHRALILTHGHEDHIGAVPYVSELIDGPIYGTPLTLALVERKLDEHGIDKQGRLVTLKPRDRVRVGAFEIEFIRVTHSMPDCVAVAIHTPLGTIIHSGDFKVDQTPLDGEAFDFHRFAELGSAGVLALFADSTNVERRGYSGSELDVSEAFEEIFTSTRGKLLVTMFSSSLHRMQILIDLAEQFDRRLCLVGRGILENSESAQRLGYLRIPAQLQVKESDVKNLPGNEVLVLATGSQGEPNSALARIAIDDHRHIKIGEDDLVVFSARAIPGNEKSIARVMNHIALRGSDVVYEGIKHVHVSGHGSQEELKLLLSLVRPRFFVPIHGEYRHLARHARVAERVTDDETKVVMVTNGDLLRLTAEDAAVDGRVTSGRVLIDGTRTGEVGSEVLRDRRHISADGLVVPVVAINRQLGTIEGVPDIITRGFVVDQRTESVLGEAAGLLSEIVEAAPLEERTDLGLVKERIRVELQRAIRRRSGRRPLVLPVVMEI
ncbi:MAG: ribonuclease J [Vicinamibacterales bacterium]